MTAPRQTTPEPPPEVIAYLESKGIRPEFSWADVWQEEHLAAFTVAGVMEADMLEDIRQAVLAAVKEGLPYKAWEKRMGAILADKGWLKRRTVKDPITGAEKDVELGKPRRMRTIFETNTRQARSAGQWGRVQRDKTFLPYLEYRLGPSEKHRPEHAAFDGLILRVDDPFWRTHMPMNGFGCKCGVRQLSAREGAARGGPHTLPALPTRGWVNPRTKKTLQVPFGVDPGFAYNPGINRNGGGF